jgi:hypothetical protein
MYFLQLNESANDETKVEQTLLPLAAQHIKDEIKEEYISKFSPFHTECVIEAVEIWLRDQGQDDAADLIKAQLD